MQKNILITGITQGLGLTTVQILMSYRYNFLANLRSYLQICQRPVVLLREFLERLFLLTYPYMAL